MAVLQPTTLQHYSDGGVGARDGDTTTHVAIARCYSTTMVAAAANFFVLFLNFYLIASRPSAIGRACFYA